MAEESGDLGYIQLPKKISLTILSVVASALVAATAWAIRVDGKIETVESLTRRVAVIEQAVCLNCGEACKEVCAATLKEQL